MRVWRSVLLCALAASARAEALELGDASPGALSLNSEATRYGTSYETVYQLNLEPRATLRVASLELSALLPLSTSATYPTFCCRLTLGNATVSAAHHVSSAGLRHWYEVSVSLPSSRWSDVHASSLAATAALLHDAGYYLHDTTSLRAGLGGDVAVLPWLSLGAAAAAHYWLRPGETTNPLIVPLTASATLSWAHAWSARASYRSLTRLLDTPATSERFLHEVSGAVAYAWTASRLEASVFLPLDESLRKLGMFSVGTSYVRSF